MEVESLPTAVPPPKLRWFQYRLRSLFVLTTLVACVVLLCVRTWLGVMGIVLLRRVTVLLNTSVIVLLTLFLLVVILRFKTLA